MTDIRAQALGDIFGGAPCLDPLDLPLRHHHIRAMLRSPAHYLAVRLGQASDEPTEAMQLGTGLHEMLAARVDVLAWQEGRPRRGKDYDDFVAAHPDALVLTAKEMHLAGEMHAAIMHDPLASPLCVGGVAEKSIVWTHPLVGRCRTTPDRLHHEAPGTLAQIVEVKTARTAEPARFVWTGRRDYGYHTQAAWHRRGLTSFGEAVQGVEVWLVVVESKAPHAVSTIRVRPSIMEAADREIDDALARIVECRAANSWPGYTPTPWDWEADENDIHMGEGAE